MYSTRGQLDKVLANSGYRLTRIFGKELVTLLAEHNDLPFNFPDVIQIRVNGKADVYFPLEGSEVQVSYDTTFTHEAISSLLTQLVEDARDSEKEA